MAKSQLKHFEEQAAENSRSFAKKLMPLLISPEQDKLGVEAARTEHQLQDLFSGKSINQRFSKAYELINQKLKTLA